LAFPNKGKKKGHGFRWFYGMVKRVYHPDEDRDSGPSAEEQVGESLIIDSPLSLS
jgi:hypothetical protein